MSREALAEFEVRQQYLSLVYNKIPGESAWTLISQGRTFSPAQTADQRDFRRIGDYRVKRMPQTVTTEVGLALYVQNHLEEVARAVGVIKPGGGWAGTEVVKFDPNFVSDYKIENYDTTDEADATLLFTEYVNEFRGAQFRIPLESESDSRQAEMSGSAYDYYIIPAAGGA
jgi:hypothetical protein